MIWFGYTGIEFINKVAKKRFGIVIRELKWIDEYSKKEVTGIEVYDGGKLIADHIEPIALGGDEWDENNIQTLCIKCNKIKTKEDAKKIAIERKREK